MNPDRIDQLTYTLLPCISHGSAPVILPGMSWISTPKLVAAVSNAGGLGILATGPLNAQATGEAIDEIRRLTNKPFAIGATLLMPGASENVEVLPSSLTLDPQSRYILSHQSIRFSSAVNLPFRHSSLSHNPPLVILARRSRSQRRSP